MKTSALFSRLPFTGLRNNPPLPNELILKIFHDLLFETGSSASLVPCLLTCVTFHNILIGEPALWTQLRADMTTANLFVQHKANTHSFWPSLQPALRLSQDRPISIVVDLATTHFLQSKITRDHLWALSHSVLWRIHGRCEEFIVRSSDWSNICELMKLLLEIQSFPKLRRFELQYIPPPTISKLHPTRDKFVSLLLLPGVGIPDAETVRNYNDRTFPNLREVVCNIPSNLDRFSATRLTSLHLDNIFGSASQPHYEQLRHTLMINSDTLTTLELGPWATGWVPEGYTTSQICTLPGLTELNLTIDTYRDFAFFVATFELPSLKRLAITDNYHRSKPDDLKNPIEDLECQIMCLHGYAAMMASWPLEQVTHLSMTCVVFYEMSGNRVWLLQPSHEQEEIWEEEGLPLATVFFYEFASVQQLTVTDVDVTTKEAMTVPPRIFNPTTGTFYDVPPLFPLLQRAE